MESVVLVTGAAGFIGLHVCRRLKDRGIRVRALLRTASSGPWDESAFCRLGQDSLPQGLMDGVDTVFHLAGVAHSFKPAKEMEHIYWSVNLEATESLLSMARAAGVRRFIFFSSIKAMREPGDRCVDEKWDAIPDDVYGRSKREAEQRVLSAGESGRMHVCNLRPVLVYGPGVKGNLLRMMKAIDNNRFPPVPETGNRRSLVHVEDLIQAAFLAAENENAHKRTYIVTDSRDYSTHELYQYICTALGKRAPQWTVPAGIFRLAGHAGDLAGRILGRPFPMNTEAVDRLLGSACYSCDRIRKELGYAPARDFLSAIGEMVQWYRKPSQGAG